MGDGGVKEGDSYGGKVADGAVKEGAGGGVKVGSSDLTTHQHCISCS